MRITLLLAWLALAFWFLRSSSSSPIDGSVIGERRKVAAADIDPADTRRTITDPPIVRIGGVDQKCSDCHALFASLDVTPSNIRQHTGVVMNHGMNGRCYNCHAKTDRNVLVLHDESTVGFSESTRLCAQCHGTVFRDWEHGMHGRTMGSWDRNSADQWRLRCVDCHDPHSPAFPDLVPLPPPNTLRMGEPSHEHGAAQGRNPLERWKQHRAAADDPEEKH